MRDDGPAPGEAEPVPAALLRGEIRRGRVAANDAPRSVATVSETVRFDAPDDALAR